MNISASRLPETSQTIGAVSPSSTTCSLCIRLSVILIFLAGCPQKNPGLEKENIQLKKQVSKLESVIQSLQEGNKVMQQQIDLLNQEARKALDIYKEDIQAAQDKMAQLANTPQKDLARMKALERENSKLTGDANWLRNQRDQMRNSLIINKVGGQTHDLPFPFLSVAKLIKKALTNNGYALLSSMHSDQKGIYITDRKTSLPPSLELSGFRNQYLVTIEKGKSDHTILWVRAEFEKLSKDGHIFSAPSSELAEIESRLIQEIHHSLSQKHSAQAKKS